MTCWNLPIFRFSIMLIKLIVCKPVSDGLAWLEKLTLERECSVCVFQSCAEQAERLAECDKAILQMKSELERQ